MVAAASSYAAAGFSAKGWARHARDAAAVAAAARVHAVPSAQAAKDGNAAAAAATCARAQAEAEKNAAVETREAAAEVDSRCTPFLL
jgi:hypothetical protein